MNFRCGRKIWKSMDPEKSCVSLLYQWSRNWWLVWLFFSPSSSHNSYSVEDNIFQNIIKLYITVQSCHTYKIRYIHLNLNWSIVILRALLAKFLGMGTMSSPQNNPSSLKISHMLQSLQLLAVFLRIFNTGSSVFLGFLHMGIPSRTISGIYENQLPKVIFICIVR